jgi:hypothetical protein
VFVSGLALGADYVCPVRDITRLTHFCMAISDIGHNFSADPDPCYVFVYLASRQGDMPAFGDNGFVRRNYA